MLVEGGALGERQAQAVCLRQGRNIVPYGFSKLEEYL